MTLRRVDETAALQLLRLCAHYGRDELDLDLLLDPDYPFDPLAAELTGVARDPERRRVVAAALPGQHGSEGNRVRLDPRAARDTLDDLARPGRSGQRWAEEAVSLLHHVFPEDTATPQQRATGAVLAPHVWPAVSRAPGSACGAALLMKLGGYLDYRGDYQACRDNQQRALPLVAATYGPQHAAVGDVLLLLGFAQLALEEYAGARSSFTGAARIYSAAYGTDDLLVAETMYCLGAAQAALGDSAGARFSCVEALRILEAGAPADDARTARVRAVLGPRGPLRRRFRPARGG